MGLVKSKIKTALLRQLPFIAKYRFVVLGLYKQTFVFLRYLPGTSRTWGPPRGIYKESAAYNHLHKDLPIQEIILKEGSTYLRQLPETNSILVTDKFKQLLTTDIMSKKAFILKNSRYIYGNGGTVITSDDKIFLPCSPLKNEWNYKRHQSLYLFNVPKATPLYKVVLIDTRACEDNYYHWLKDHISRFGWLRQLNLDLSDYTLISSYGTAPYQTYSYKVLELMGFKFKEYRGIKNIKSFSAEELVVPPYVTKALNSDTITFDVESKEFLKELFLSDDAIRIETYKKIYLSRRRSNRSSPQESILVKELEKQGIKEIFLEDFNISQQARLFNEAELIIGFHGAALTNLLFCKPGTKIVEIFGPDFIVSDFWSMASQTNLNYYAYCDDEYKKGIKSYNLARLAPTMINVPNFIQFLNDH